MPSLEAQSSPYEQLCRLIAIHRLKPGDRVPSIRELARRFNASPVAVRDALVQAEREGLVEIRARSGAFVRSAGRAEQDIPHIEDLGFRVVDGYQLHLCHAREILEVEMAAQAAERCRPADLLPIREALENWLRGHETGDMELAEEADRRFHVGIARMAGNPVIASILNQCLHQQYILECATPDTTEDRKKIAAIHAEIYDALRDRDAERARDAMQRHMQHLKDNIHQMLLTPPLKDALKSGRPKRRKGQA